MGGAGLLGPVAAEFTQKLERERFRVGLSGWLVEAFPEGDWEWSCEQVELPWKEPVVFLRPAWCVRD